MKHGGGGGWGKEVCSKAVNRERGWDAAADAALATATQVAGRLNRAAAPAVPAPGVLTPAASVPTDASVQPLNFVIVLDSCFAKIHMKLRVNDGATVVPW